MIYITNALSLNMLPAWVRETGDADISVRVRSVQQVRTLLDTQPYQSAVGHADTAKVMTALLGRPIEPNRVSVELSEYDILIVGQYTAPRLPEGATELPEEDAEIIWWEVWLSSPSEYFSTEEE